MVFHSRARIVGGTESRAWGVVRAGTDIRERDAMLPGLIRFMLREEGERIT